jgi:hypothetical protein
LKKRFPQLLILDEKEIRVKFKKIHCYQMHYDEQRQDFLKLVEHEGYVEGIDHDVEYE